MKDTTRAIVSVTRRFTSRSPFGGGEFFSVGIVHKRFMRKRVACQLAVGSGGCEIVISFSRYHRLARWSLMLAARAKNDGARPDATGLSRGNSRWLLVSRMTAQREAPRDKPVASRKQWMSSL